MQRVIFVLVIFFLASAFVYAHPGRTASDGCHVCRTDCARWGVPTGERHCHSPKNKMVTIADTAPSAGKDIISKKIFKGTWPFTVTEGRIICGPSMALGFKSQGITYAVNGLAHKLYSDITPIWLPDPSPLGKAAGIKVSIGDVLSYGLKYCGF